MANTERISPTDIQIWGAGLTGEGQNRNINHEGCSAGLDTKKRLYLLRKNNGVILAYCHHCGASGAYFPSDRAYVRPVDWVPKNVIGTQDQVDWYKNAVRVYLNPATRIDFDDWPFEYKLWWLNMGFDKEDAVLFGVRYVDLHGAGQAGVVLPSVSGMYLQVRTHTKNGKMFKSYRDCADRLFWIPNHHLPKPHGKAPIIITEDICSAYKVSKFGEHWGLALCGTSLCDEQMRSLITAVRVYPIYLWLDADAAGIKGTKKMVDSLKLSAKELYVVRSDKEVKHIHDKDEYLRLIKDAIRVVV